MGVGERTTHTSPPTRLRARPTREGSVSVGSMPRKGSPASKEPPKLKPSSGDVPSGGPISLISGPSMALRAASLAGVEPESVRTSITSMPDMPRHKRGTPPARGARSHAPPSVASLWGHTNDAARYQMQSTAEGRGGKDEAHHVHLAMRCQAPNTHARESTLRHGHSATGGAPTAGCLVPPDELHLRQHPDAT